MATRKRKPKHRTAPPDLTAREARFCRHFAEHGNATQAAADAGFTTTAGRPALSTRAFELLRKPEIRKLIRRMQAEAADAAQVGVDRVAQGLARQAFADRAAIFDAKGRMLPPKKWPAELRAILVGVDVVERRSRGKVVEVVHKPRFVNPAEPLRVLAQWLGMIGAKASDAADGAAEQLVVGGEADPGKL